MTFAEGVRQGVARPTPTVTESTRPVVLHVVEALSSGVATALEDYVRCMPAHRHVILSHRRPEAQTGDSLAELASADLTLPLGHLARMRAIRNLLRRLAPDVVHAHSSLAGVYTRLAAGDRRGSVVYTPHCFAFERTDVSPVVRAAFWLVEAALTRGGGYVAASSPREAELARRLGGRATVVYVPCAPHIPIEPPGSGRADGRVHRVVAVGRLAAQKDPRFFASAARVSRELAPDTRWIWVGGGDPAYERLLRDAGVEVTGWLSRSATLERLRGADVYVHTAAWEATGLTILEAAALGLPIVARSIPATRSLGLARLQETPEGLASAVLELRDARVRADLKAQSQLLLRRHQPGSQRRALEEVYQLAMHGTAGPSESGAAKVVHDDRRPPAIRAPLRVTVVLSPDFDREPGAWWRGLAGSPRLALEAIILGHGTLAAELRCRGIRTRVLAAPDGRASSIRTGAALWRALQGSNAELAVFANPALGAVVVSAARLAGTRTAWIRRPGAPDRRWLGRLADAAVPIPGAGPEKLDRLLGDLSTAACRPGAGLCGGPPMTVVSTVLNEGPAVDQLLERLQFQLGPGDEAVIVDGGSVDDTVERIQVWTRRDPRIRLLRAPRTNISAGRNRGIAEAGRAVVACTDAGCTPADGWLDALRAPFAEIDPPSLATGLYRAVGDRPIDRAMAVANYPDPREARRLGPLARAYGKLLGRTFDPALCTGRSMAVTVDAWRAVGGFPEALATGEDVTFGRLVASTGRRCVLAVDAEVEWSPRSSLAATAKMYQSYGRGDAESGDQLLIVRNLARALAYLSAVPVCRWGRRPGRLMVAAGTAAYLSLPVARSLRRDRPLAVIPRIPLALAVKDLAKAAGCLQAALGRRPYLTGRRPRGWTAGRSPGSPDTRTNGPPS
jgi:glycosyltransferase involved in cell wall biosynthesis/GT2 family glycosyltransferase